MPFYERRNAGSCRVMGEMRGDKLGVSDGLTTTMPVVATMDPASRRFVLTLQALKAGVGVIYNATEYVPFDLPGWVTPPYSAVQRFEPWAQLAVQVDPSDSQIKVYMGAWSGDGKAVHSLCVFRAGLFFVP